MLWPEDLGSALFPKQSWTILDVASLASVRLVVDDDNPDRFIQSEGLYSPSSIFLNARNDVRAEMA